MATHSSILAWKIPWTEEPGRLQPIGLQRVKHCLATEKQHLLKRYRVFHWMKVSSFIHGPLNPSIDRQCGNEKNYNILASLLTFLLNP